MMNLFNKKNGIRILLASFLLYITLLPHYAFAGWFDSPAQTILSGITTAVSTALLPIIIQLTLVLQIIASLFLGLAGFMFSAVINHSVVGMQSLVNKMVFIDTAWATFRDLANIFFIFILLYVAIGTILNLNGINTKKMLVSVVITAIFLNFSLFFTKIAIDASNLLAINIHKSIVGDSWNIGSLLIGQTGMQTFYTLFRPGVILNPTQTIITQLGSSIFMFIAAFVIFSVALFFIIRFVVLVFLMILSPLAFAAMALPKDEYSKKWKETLISQCIFAPLCMALLWITVNVSGELTKQTQSSEASFVDLLNPDLNPATNPGHNLEQAMIMLFNYIVLISMLIFSLVISKSFASKGAGQMMKMAEWAQGKAGRAMVRGTGVAYLDRKFADSKFGKGVIGRNIRSMTTGAITGFDGFGDKKSVQKVDKETKKLNEEYGKKMREDDEKSDLKKHREDTIKNHQQEIKQHEQTQVESELKLQEAEERLRTEAAAGRVFGKDTLEQEKERLENMKREYASMSGDDGGQKDRLIAEQEQKIRDSEQIHKTIEENREKLQSSAEALRGKGKEKGLYDKVKEVRMRMEDKAGASTDEERAAVRTAMRKRADELEKSWRTGKGLLSKIPVLRKVKIPIVKDFFEDVLSAGDGDAAVKAYRKNKGKVNLKELAKDIESGGVESGGDDGGGGDEEKGKDGK
ncbi:MAG: hypothetical protein U0522_00990 [Candidatus Paceibacterota bacterium]